MAGRNYSNQDGSIYEKRGNITYTSTPLAKGKSDYRARQKAHALKAAAKKAAMQKAYEARE
jgi:hypothetical protein